MGEVLQLRDYKRREEREAELERACLAAVSEALFYEEICDKPRDSFVGVYQGVPVFEAPSDDCA